MAGPSPLNSACNCCAQPPTPAIDIQYASISQSCSASSCGFVPCTSDSNNDCVPNFEELTTAEKCSGKRYLVKEIRHKDGHLETTTCTIEEDGTCGPCNTVCEGSIVTTETCSLSYSDSGIFTDQLDQPIGTYTDTASTNSTNTVTETYNEDCTVTTTFDCSGSSSFSSVETWDDETREPFNIECNSTLQKDEDGFCEWSGSVLYTQFPPPEEISGPCLSCPSGGWVFGGGPSEVDVSQETTVEPEPTAKSTTTYSQENTQGICHPKELPDYPAFINCTPEGEEPPEPPELVGGQGNQSEAFKFQHPNNPAIKSEQKVKYRIEHQPSGTCYLKVWFRKIKQKYKWEDCETGFAGDPPRTPPLTVNCETSPCTNRWSTDGEPTTEDDGNYEWEGSGYPCYEDEHKVFTACENRVYSAQTKDLIAGENESVTLQIKYSFIKNYEPNWPDKNGCQGCKPNGFPITNPEDCPVCEEE